MELKSISKALYFTGGCIEISYRGIPTNDNVDFYKIDALLEDFIINHRHNYMIENVSIVRTILKDFEEKFLIILYQDEKGSERVIYDNSNLCLYEKSKREENSEYNRYMIKYEPQHGIKLDYNNRETDVANYRGIELMSKEITEIMQQIYYLKSIKAVILDTDDKSLKEIDKICKELPDIENLNQSIDNKIMKYENKKSSSNK